MAATQFRRLLDDVVYAADAVPISVLIAPNRRVPFNVPATTRVTVTMPELAEPEPHIPPVDTVTTLESVGEESSEQARARRIAERQQELVSEIDPYAETHNIVEPLTRMRRILSETQAAFQAETLRGLQRQLHWLRADFSLRI